MIYEKVQHFHKRAILFPMDHERREKRMFERAEARRNDFTLYYGLDEQELMYKDYYESEFDSEEDAMEDENDYEELLSSGIFDFKNYNFVEEGTDHTVPTVESVFENKMFKFKHRQWSEDTASHLIRENRMTKRYFDRISRRDPDVELDLNEADLKNPSFAKKYIKYQDYIKNEAIQQYKDYYESDAEDIKDFDHITPEEKEKFAVVFKDYARPLKEVKGYIHAELREYDNSKGFLQNLSEHFADVRNNIIPELKKEIKIVANIDLELIKAKNIEIKDGTYKFEVVQGFEDIFAEHQKELEEFANSPIPKQ